MASSGATLSTEVVRGTHGEDDLSILPDELRGKIVSRLPIKEAVRTTALATGWRRIWHSAPLSLYDTHLLPSRGNVRTGIVNSVLAAHPGEFDSVHLESCFMREETELAELSRLLAAGKVKDLVLVSLNPVVIQEDLMRLPADILRCDKLRRLYLGFWKFPDTSDGAGGFPLLVELGIIDTRMEPGDLDYMLASSPKLKKVALISTRFPKHVHLRGHTLHCVLFWLSAIESVLVDEKSLDLEQLIIWDKSPMELTIASKSGLKVLGYFKLRSDTLKIGDTVIKVDTEVSPESMITSVKILALDVYLNSFTEAQMLVRFLRCFPNVETLHVECRIPSYYFEVMTVNNADEFFENLNSDEFKKTQINKVVLHNFHGHQTEMALLRYLSQTAGQMQQLTLVLSGRPRDETSGDEIKSQLVDLVTPPWATEACTFCFWDPRRRSLLGPSTERLIFLSMTRFFRMMARSSSVSLKRYKDSSIVVVQS